MDSVETFVSEGLALFDGGFSCAEAVFMAGMQHLGRGADLVPRLATGFGGGVARTQSLCGALSGAVLVLGAAYGRDKPADDRTVVFGKVQSLMHGFRGRFGSDNCFALTGLDFNAPGGLETYKSRVHGVCRGYVDHALRAMYELLPPRA